MSDIVGAKAISLVTNGGIEEKPARVFEAQGSTGTTYVVVLGAGRHDGSCTCPAGREGRRCYHVAAARLLVAKERER
jgi:uncharacterized Zn finger protein